AAAFLVHVDHGVAAGRERPDQTRIARHGLLEHDRTHPGIVHIAQLRADAAGDVDEVSLVAERGAAAIDRCALIVLAQFDVMSEAAAAEHDGFAREEALFALGGVGLDADDFAL